jgi:hypothetical protein
MKLAQFRVPQHEQHLRLKKQRPHCILPRLTQRLWNCEMTWTAKVARVQGRGEGACVPWGRPRRGRWPRWTRWRPWRAGGGARGGGGEAEEATGAARGAAGSYAHWMRTTPHHTTGTALIQIRLRLSFVHRLSPAPRLPAPRVSAVDARPHPRLRRAREIVWWFAVSFEWRSYDYSRSGIQF